MNAAEIFRLVWVAFLETLYMTIPATIAAYAVGLPLGVILVITAADHIRQHLKAALALLHLQTVHRPDRNTGRVIAAVFKRFKPVK